MIVLVQKHAQLSVDNDDCSFFFCLSLSFAPHLWVCGNVKCTSNSKVVKVVINRTEERKNYISVIVM